MKSFLHFLETSTNELTLKEIKHKLIACLSSFNSNDRDWAVWLLSGGLKNSLTTKNLLKEEALKRTGIHPWLFDECVINAGNILEAISLLFKAEHNLEVPLSDLIENQTLPLKQKGKAEVAEIVLDTLPYLETDIRLFWLKIVTNSLNLNIPQGCILDAISHTFQIPLWLLSQRLNNGWAPGLFQLDASPNDNELTKSPCSFLRFEPCDIRTLSSMEDLWVIPRHGEICQIVRTIDSLCIYLAKGEMVSSTLFTDLFELLPSETVVFADMIDRRILYLFDILKVEGKELSHIFPLDRYEILKNLIVEHKNPSFCLQTPLVLGDELTEDSQNLRLQGIQFLLVATPDKEMCTYLEAPTNPLSLRAALVNAEQTNGHENPFSNLTFALCDDAGLVPIGKALLRLSAEEADEIFEWMSNNVKDKFGPVRTFPPKLIFEIHFSGLKKSKRRKCGFELLFPEVTKWHRDFFLDHVDNVNSLKGLFKNR